MKFGNLQALHFLWLLPALTLLFILALKKRKKAMETFADRGLLDEITPSLDKRNRTVKALFIFVSLFLIIIALIRPQWGFEWKEVRRSGLDIVIALDTSKSMLAEDVKPNRLERSKLAVKDLVKNLRGDRVGLIAFAGSAFLQCPLTVDYGGFLLSLDSLDVNTIPRGSTSIASAIRVALDSYGEGMKKNKILVIITDGEDHEADPLPLSEKAKERGVRIFTIGIGTNEGELIPVKDPSGGVSFLKDRKGNVIKTRLDEKTLKDIALTTGGSYVKAAQTGFGLDVIYEEKLSSLEKGETDNKRIKKFEERFQFPLILALLLLCIEPFIGERKRGERNVARAMKKFFLSIFFLSFLSIPALPAQASSTAGEIRDGNRAYKEEKYDEALEHYMSAREKAPESDIVQFNLGAALYKNGRYGESIDAFIKALNTEDGQLESDALYNIANAKYKLGSADADKDLKGAINLYRESLEYFRRAIELNEHNREAKFNHEVVEKDLKVLLERLKNQPQQEQQDQDKEREDTKEDGQSPAGAEEEQTENKAGGGKDRTPAAEEEGKEEAGEDGEQQQDSASGEGDIREMSPEEARMLLDAYGDEQAIDGTKQGTKGYDPEVLKDW